MSRTSSQTLPYWQFEVGLFDDGKNIELSDKYGPLGEAVLFRIMCYITQSDGYFAQLNDALILYVYRSIGSKWVKNKRIISEVIHYCGVCGLFDVNLLSRNVITSQGIQRRWLYAKKKNRAKGYSTAKYWLLSEEETVQGEERSDEDKCNINADKCNNNADNCDINSYIKESKEKEKESEQEDIKVSKKVSNKKENLQSYDEIFSDMEVSDRLKSALIDFIRHLKTSYGILMINSRLEGLLVKLDMKYGEDTVAKCKEVRRAITNGYKRLECEGED